VFGENEHAATLAGAALGGQVRVGFEHNLLLKDRAHATDSAAPLRQRARGRGRGAWTPLLAAECLQERLVR
jgi:uncharacterized protein (DUF849 family)